MKIAALSLQNQGIALRGTPWVDPVVAQLHALREQLSAQHGNDLAEISRAAGVTAAKWGFVEKALPARAKA
jgi:hypothetical protein